MWTTADLCDQYGGSLQIAQPLLRHYGGVRQFSGAIATARVQDDNTSVRLRLEELGWGRVLVVDGGGSQACALVGDQLGELAQGNGWAGIVVYGCVRDSAALGALALGVLAVGTMPRRSEKRGPGEHDVPVSFAGITFMPGHFLYADEDGVVVAANRLD